MDETRRSAAIEGSFRRLAVRDATFTNLVLFGYILLATLIAGAASAGAGLALLAIGLLTVLTLDFARWRADEKEAGLRTGWELFEPRPRPSRPFSASGRASEATSAPVGRAEPLGAGASSLASGRNGAASSDAGTQAASPS